MSRSMMREDCLPAPRGGIKQRARKVDHGRKEIQQIRSSGLQLPTGKVGIPAKPNTKSGMIPNGIPG
jgi:hypothetical protein